MPPLKSGLIIAEAIIHCVNRISQRRYMKTVQRKVMMMNLNYNFYLHISLQSSNIESACGFNLKRWLCCSLWPLSGSTLYTHGTYIFWCQAGSTFQLHTVFMILWSIYRSNVQFLLLWFVFFFVCGPQGWNKSKPFKKVTITRMTLSESHLVPRAPNYLAVDRIQCLVLRTDLKRHQPRCKINSQDIQEIKLNLFRCVGSTGFHGVT